MLRTTAVCIIALTLMCVCGCGAPEAIDVKVDGDKTVGLRMGQLLRLKLDSNPTTGYSWDIASSPDAGVVRQFEKMRYVREGELIGSGGYQLYRFKPLKKGTATISFEYKRPWEKDAEPVKKYTVRIVVN